MGCKSLGIVGLLIALAGCAAPIPDAVDAAGAAAAPTQSADAWNGTARLLLAERAPGNSVELDLLCQTGGGMEHDRADGRVLAGASHVEVRVSASPATTGVQIGYAIDGGEVTWLPVVRDGEATFEIPVTDDLVEAPEGKRRWAFWHQMGTPASDDQCYTGANAGDWGFVAEAVRGA